MMILLIDKLSPFGNTLTGFEVDEKNMLIVIFIAVSPLVFNGVFATYYRKDKVNARTYAMNNSMLIQVMWMRY